MRGVRYLIAALGLLAFPDAVFCGARHNAARNPVEIEFEGIESFAVDGVRHALAVDVSMQAASHPRSDIAEYLRTLRQSLWEGYQSAGYLNVKLSARHDEATGRIKVRIQEGKRYRAGTVEVTGIEPGEALALKAALTEPFPPWDAVPVTIAAPDGSTQTIWETSQGEPARLLVPLWPRDGVAQWGVAAWSDAWGRITRYLGATGRFNAEFTCEAVPDQKGETALLVVKFKALGPVSTVAVVVVEGARRNTPEEVKEFLGLREGVEISVRKSALWEHRLWSSGRFISAYVRTRKAKSAPDDRSRWDVHVSLHEHPAVPLLRAPLSPEDRLLLKSRDWLARRGQLRPEEDVTVEVEWSPRVSFLPEWFRKNTKIKGRMVCGASRGQIVSWSIAHDAVQPAFSETLILRDPRITFFSPERSTRLEFDRPEIGKLGLRVIAYAGDPEKIKAGESKFGCNFGFEGGTSSNPNAHSLETRIEIDPVVALAWPRMQGCKCARREGCLFLSSKTVYAEIEEQTGRIIELRFDDKPVGLSLLVRTTAGAVAAEMERQDKLLATSLNMFDSERPLHTVALFAASEWSRFAEAELSAASRKRAIALRKLLSLWTPEPLGDLVRPLLPESDPGAFQIPTAENRQRSGELELLILPLHGILVPVYDAAAPSAPSWSLGRDALLTAVAHRSGLINLQSARAECGPIGHLAAAVSLRETDPRHAVLLAHSGLEHLSGAEFYREYSPLLAQNTWLTRNILSLAAATRRFERSEIRALAGFLPKKFSPDAVAESLLQLTSDPQRPLPAAVEATLDRLWERTLRDLVASQLNEIIENTRDATPGSIEGSAIQQVSGQKP